MKAEFIVPFVDAATSVGEEITGLHPTRGDLELKNGLVTSLPINFLCSIRGDIEGIAMFGLSRETAMKIAETILDQKLRVFDQTVSSAIVGIGAKICEAFMASLSNQGLSVTLSHSALFRGTFVNVPTFGVPTLVVPVQFEGYGTISVNVSVKKSIEAVAA